MWCFEHLKLIFVFYLSVFNESLLGEFFVNFVFLANSTLSSVQLDCCDLRKNYVLIGIVCLIDDIVKKLFMLMHIVCCFWLT